MSGFKDFRFPILILCLLLLDITLVVWSCSGRSNMDLDATVVPPDKMDNVEQDDGNIPILVTAVDDDRLVSGLGLLGLYQVQIDSSNETGEAVQIRTSSALGDPHDVDITGFLQSSPCQDCFQLSGVEYTAAEKLIATFHVEHPFGLPENNPPMPNERLDLHVFDLAGIIFMSSGLEGSTSYPDLTAHVSVGQSSTTLSSDNSGFWAFDEWDGFTNDFDAQVDNFYPTQATIHPYKILSLDSGRGNVNGLSANGFNDVRNPSGHNVFAQESSFDTTIGFNVIPGQSIEFLIALTAAYGQSAAGRGNLAGQRGNPRYFIPEFNRKDAWRVNVAIPEETDLLGHEDLESSTLLMVNVWDWQQNYGYPMEDIDPYTSRLDALRNSSRVDSIVVDIPGVNDLDVATIPFDGDGYNDTPLVYRITVQNDKAAMEGNYNGLVGVVDDMHGTPITDYGIERDGITAFDVADFVTYAPFQVSVVDRGAENFGVNMSMTGFGDDSGHLGLIPDASDSHNIASYYYNVVAVYSAVSATIGNMWDVYFQKSTDLGATWQDSIRINLNTYGNQRNGTIQVNRMTGDIYIAYVDFSGSLPGAKGTDVVMVRSMDGGGTFSEPVIINSSRYGIQDQISIGVDDQGVIYAAWRTQITEEETYIAWAVSHDGESFSEQSVLSYGGFSGCENPIIAIDKGILSPHIGQVYLIYRRNSYLMPDIVCSRYADNSGFSTPFMVSNEIFGEALSPSLAVNNQGAVFVSYIDNAAMPPAVKVARSTSMGYSWSHSGPLNYSIGGEEPGPPVLIVRQNNNFMYLIWDDSVEGDRNVYSIRSTNGITYIQPTKLNNDLTTRIQDYPAASVNQFGNFFVIWRDMRLTDIGEMYFTRGGT